MPINLKTYAHRTNLIITQIYFFLYLIQCILHCFLTIFIGGDMASTGKMLTYSCMSRDSSNLVNQLGKLISADYGYVAAA